MSLELLPHIVTIDFDVLCAFMEYQIRGDMKRILWNTPRDARNGLCKVSSEVATATLRYSVKMTLGCILALKETGELLV